MVHLALTDTVVIRIQETPLSQRSREQHVLFKTLSNKTQPYSDYKSLEVALVQHNYHKTLALNSPVSLNIDI